MTTLFDLLVQDDAEPQLGAVFLRSTGKGTGFAIGEASGERDKLPERRKPHQNVDKTRENGCLATEDRSYQVELQKPDEAPVDATHDDEPEGDDVDRAHEAPPEGVTTGPTDGSAACSPGRDLQFQRLPTGGKPEAGE